MVMEIPGCSKPLAISQEKDEALREAVNTVLNQAIKTWEDLETEWILNHILGMFYEHTMDFVSIK